MTAKVLQKHDHIVVDDSLLDSLAKSSLCATFSMALDDKIVNYSSMAETMFGYSKKDILEKTMSVLFLDDAYVKFKSNIEKIKNNQLVDFFETDIMCQDKSMIHAHVYQSPIKNFNGSITGISVLINNNSNSKIIDKPFVNFDDILASTDDAILSMDISGKITSWNLGATKMFGYSKDEIIGKPIQLIYPHDRIDELSDILKKLNSGKHVDHFETERQHKDGYKIDVSMSISTIRNNNGEIIGIAKIIRDISGQKRTSAYARSLIEASLDPLVTISLDGKITDVNEATVKITGVDRESIIGSDFSDYFTEPSQAREGYERVFKEGFVTDYPLSIRNSSGKIIDVLYNASVYKDDKGNVLGVFAAARDVTETKKVSAYARSLIEASLDPLVTISPEGIVTDVNQATIQITGVSREKLVGSDFSNYFTEPEEAREGYERVFKEGFVTDYPLTIRNSSGQITDVLYNASVYRDDKGNVLGVFAAARDVTERKKAEDQLHTTFAYARSLIEASLDPLVTISPDGKITDVNEATVKITGVAREWLIGTDFSNYFTEPRKARQGYRLTFKEGSVKDYPLTIHHSSDEVTDVLYNASVYKNDKGKVLGVFAAARDVTETKKVSAYARSLIEASLDPLVTISPEGKITDVNEATAKITGVSREKLVGSDFSNYFTEPRKAREGYERVFKEGFVTDYPLSIRNSSGQITDVLYNASVYKDDKGNVLGVFAAARNATRVRQKDEFSAMITHELKTPLSPIIGYCKILSTGTLGVLTDEQHNAIEVINKNGKRLETLINDIMDVRKIDLNQMNFIYEDLHILAFFKQIVSSYKDVLQNKGIDFVTKFPYDEFTVNTDSLRLRQIIDNILQNAIKFVPAKNGRIELSCVKEKDDLVICVKDNGVGIPVHKQENLFKKFYQIDTSLRRPSNGGTGLGLAISKGLIEHLGGTISMTSDGRTGSKFCITLKLVRDKT